MNLTCAMCGHPLASAKGGEPPASIVCPICGTTVSGGGPESDLSRQTILSKVRPPAIGLMIAGVLAVLFSMALPPAMFTPFNEIPTDEDDRDVFILDLAVTGVIRLSALAMGTIVTIGGYRMYHLRSRVLALVAAIVTTSAILLCCTFGPPALFGLIATPIGIWSLVVLTRPAVIAEFRRNALHKAPS